jgi:bacteriorhodopsin
MQSAGPIDAPVRNSFMFSYIFLSGLTLITFIEAMRTKNMKIRNILNLETTVSLVATLVYSIFIDKINKNELRLEDVTQYRYYDWSITTPMLILVLLIFFSFSEHEPVLLATYAHILFFNYVMLLSGYLGETKQISKPAGSAIGFAAFAAMIWIIYANFITTKSPFAHVALFATFATVWTLYGVAYWLPVREKNMMYNGLDVIAKVFFGLYMWANYSNVFTV